MNKPIYALSIKQPWAWLICRGFKDIENRDWSTRFRGRIYVHASKSESEITQETIDWFKSKLSTEQHNQLKGKRLIDVLVFGAIIGEITITDCGKSKSPWFVGKYGFTLANPVIYDNPIPCRGQPGFFKPEIKEK
jgi:hypothetical protein